MSYVIERHGPAACPDNPMRVGSPDEWTPEQERRYEDCAASLFGEYLCGVFNVLSGGKPYVEVRGTKYDGGQLYDALTENEESDTLYPLLTGRASIGQGLVSDWCRTKAYEQADIELTEGRL